MLFSGTQAEVEGKGLAVKRGERRRWRHKQGKSNARVSFENISPAYIARKTARGEFSAYGVVESNKVLSIAVCVTNGEYDRLVSVEAGHAVVVAAAAALRC